MDRSEAQVMSSEDNDVCLPSNSSSDEGPNNTSRTELVNLEDSQCSVISNCSLKRSASTPLLPYTSTPLGFKHVHPSDASIQIPIVGYEVMEERARFTVYKIKIENKTVQDSWFIFRRYTDFVRLHSKLKLEFPKIVLTLPRKRWFGNNFSLPFIEERIKGLQSFIDSIVNNKELMESKTIRDFFCLDEPPSYSEIGEESRAIFEALEDTIYQLRLQLGAKEAEIMNMRMSINNAQEKAVTVTQKLNEVKTCERCKEKVQDVSDELQQVLCLQFTSSGS
ncbi:sorting nexin-16 [Macrosteles quadrilineatus]|uniref:sorting nexin-16 n=1 Tax=Macrosteles quadrilineatus TaxID=74068 RepID=UPI0023E1FCB0|nr:sorting nexin-16 [Macrosteles quadrilineatus]